MNYKHAFHAGNFADVFKHIVLVSIIQALKKKDTAFCFLDTHAGFGRYDLFSDEAQATKEFKNGIAKLLTAGKPPGAINDYLDCVRNINASSKSVLRIYPGSPTLARFFLRPIDHMILSEIDPDAYASLRNLFKWDEQVSIHFKDSYQGLKAFIPPEERRGVVLIDPPYEKDNELAKMASLLKDASSKWETGIYTLWFPIKNKKATEQFYKELSKLKRPYIISELCIYPDDVDGRLNGCGMVVVNPPWKLENELNTIIPWLKQVLMSEGKP